MLRNWTIDCLFQVADDVEAGFLLSVKFLRKECVKTPRELPCRTQLAPLASALTHLRERWLEPRITKSCLTGIGAVVFSGNFTAAPSKLESRTTVKIFCSGSKVTPLRADDFDAFYKARKAALVKLVERAMGKRRRLPRMELSLARLKWMISSMHADVTFIASPDGGVSVAPSERSGADQSAVGALGRI